MDMIALPAVDANRPDLSNRNFFWGWFAAVNAALLMAVLVFGRIVILAPIVGVGGAFLSLWFSKQLAIKAHGIKLVNQQAPASGADAELARIVTDLSQQAGLPATPAIGVYASPDLNAFATGASQSDALVAFSSALIDTMPPEHIRAVAAHEIAHIANRDMLGMVMLQGVVNSVVIALVAPINFMRVANLFSDRFTWFFEGACWLMKTVIAGVVTFAGSLMVKGYSRQREFRADATAARWVGAAPMAAAQRSLGTDEAAIPKEQLGYAALKIAGRSPYGEFFSTHPHIDRRIAALDALAAGETSPAA